MMKAKKNSRGFTLMEMLVALVMGAIVVTPLYIVTRGLTEQTNLEQQETEAMQRARIGLHTLMTDLSRTGMHASPNPIVDRKSALYQLAGAWEGKNRRAVAHLNPSPGVDGSGNIAMDSFIIVGSFIESNTRAAFYEASGAADSTFVTYQQNAGDPVMTQDECEKAFSATHGAFAHIEAHNGTTFDSPILSSSFAAGRCTIQIDETTPPGMELTVGDTLHISANQAVLYRTEQTGVLDDGSQRTDLVRYFVNYLASPPGTGCVVDSDFLLDATRQVVAQYITDFQIWFRPVRPTSAGTAVVPHIPNYYLANTLVTPDLDFTMSSESNHLFPTTPGATPGGADLTCAANAANDDIGPEYVRSAVVRLSVRTEKTDQQILAVDPGTGADIFDLTPADRIRFNLARNRQPCTSTLCSDNPNAVFKVKTVITEVEMPNLAARSDIQ